MVDPATKRRRTEGITVPTAAGARRGKAAVVPADRHIFSPRDRRTILKSFKSLSEARAWRADTQAALRHGAVGAPTRTTLEEAAAEWLAAAELVCARTRSGDPLQALGPSLLRGGPVHQGPARAGKVASVLGRPRLCP